jgi:glycosyltransferase involved in cell wall biosynthesis
MPSQPLALTWALSTMSGYGIYGLQIALQFFRRGGEKFIPTHAPGPVALPALTTTRLNPVLDLARKISSLLHDKPEEQLTFDHPVLHAVGNECAGFPGQDRISGNINVGCAAIEHAHFGQHGQSYAKNYDMFIAISRWNEKFLKSLDQAPVHLCFQGIDTTLFMPGPKTGLWGDRFIIFSGGKFEFRKAQDIVVEAFRRFQARHPDALLITCWQTFLPSDPAPFILAGHCQTIPLIDENHGLQDTQWLLDQGLPQGSFMTLPYTPNMLMPPILRECDAAIFPNRCEGGTNLVAMEAMACGVPTIVANNTGQKDLVDLLGARAFETQTPIKASPGMACTDDWMETDPDEIVEMLEDIYTNTSKARNDAAIMAKKIKEWDWGPLNEKLLTCVLGK